MTTAAIASPAAIGAALSGVMAASDIGSVPVDVMDGHVLAFGPEGMEQGKLEPLVRLGLVKIDVKSMPGYWESAGRESTPSSVELKRGWLESKSFFKDWSRLQGDANWAASFGQNGLQGAASQAASDFAAACAHQAMGDSGGSDASQNRVAARRKYEEVAIVYEVEKNFTAAAMVWERAATNPDHVIPERLRKLHRGRAARAWYRSLPRLDAQLDPVSLRLARGIWHAYGNDDKYYRMLLMKAAKWNEHRNRSSDAGAYKLRIALSVLGRERVSRTSWSVASNMIASAAELFEGAGRRSMDKDGLMGLARKAGRISEGS